MDKVYLGMLDGNLLEVDNVNAIAEKVLLLIKEELPENARFIKTYKHCLEVAGELIEYKDLRL